MPALPILVLAALATMPQQTAKLTRYKLEVVVDPKAHRIVIDGNYREGSGKQERILTVRTIHNPISQKGEAYSRGFAVTAGTIQPEGVYLGGSSKWYPPPAGGGLVTFDLTVDVPPGWDAMSQGRREVLERDEKRTRMRFVADDPQEEIWLVAGPWTETKRTIDGVDALTLLRRKDDGLSAKYLDATGDYIAMYSKLLGPYPYPKFALVENFWETGYGMPSFTLLGSAVIRLPFIITTSYPHEILHNWWGNGVYVAPEGGNWSEGLTAYLADHLFAEQHGNGAAYRQETLQKYADYASRGKDFPLSSFTERHSAATEAVGYGKALMLFHMMRRRIGDEAFINGLRTLYAERKFTRASFNDVRDALGAAGKQDLAPAFARWVGEPGAPRLSAKDVAATRDADGGWHLRGTIEQVQAGNPYSLSIPIAITLEGTPAAMQLPVDVSEKETAIDIKTPARPLRLDVDPEFDLFRMLDVEEAPPALSGAFGADETTMILPADAPAALQSEYRALGQAWNEGRKPAMRIVNDASLTVLPTTGSIFVIGYENRFAHHAAEALTPYAATTTLTGDRAVALVARRRRGEPAVIAFVAAARAAQVAGLARKLPHYHKYSRLVFEGDEPTNIEKGRWPVLDSPMTALLTDNVEMGTLAQREPLAELPPAFSKERMLGTVRALAGSDMKGRGAGTAELDRAAAMIKTALLDAGLEVQNTDASTKNVVGILRGTKTEWAGQSVVVSAHYDHLGTVEGAIHPGADDNASGVAVLVELARQMASGERPARTVIFAAFAGEETGLAGSKAYVAAASTWPAAKAIGMVNLDTVGRLGNGKILVLGTGTADEWIHIVNGAGYVTGAPVEAVAADPGGSDQKSFTDAGVPAVQIFTGPNADYHRPTDTVDKIDAAGLVKVASVARELVAYLAERPTPLTSKLATAGQAAAAPAAPAAGGERRASLGSIPDYAFAGTGVRITGTTPGSPAEKAGLKEGDVIVKLGDVAVSTLREYAEALKAKAPGDGVTVTVIRDGKTITVDATLAAR
jgi:aminopeptidase N